MDNIFGISVTSILIVLLVILGLCLLSVAYVAIRNRVIFKMAVRNIPRRKTQSILIMVGLMLATLIIAAALTTGDTLDYTITELSYESLGEVDQIVAFVGGTGGRATTSVNNEPISTDLVDRLETEFAGDPDIDGFLPMLTIDVPAVNLDQRLSQPSVILTGLDETRLEPFGGLRDPNGNVIANPFENGTVVISESLSNRINAGVGSQVTIFYQNEPIQVEVGAIGQDGIFTGINFMSDGPPGNHGLAVPIEWLQDLTGLEGQARFIAVTNVGDMRTGVERSDEAVSKLRGALQGEPLGVGAIKQRAVQDAELIASVFMSLFIVLGLFSVAAGVLLIFLIFMMLAAERRSEMGMARAVGMKQRHLVQQFLAEGTVYDLGAALIGAAAGVGVAYVMAGVMSNVLGDEFNIVPHFTLRSLAVAYSLGVTVTFVTIIFASVRAARLNIVAAIRDTPEGERPRSDRPRWRWRNLRPILFWKWLFSLISYFRLWGPLLTPIGILMMAQGWQGGRWSAFWYSMGISLLGFGLMLLLQRWLPRRPVFTVISAIVLFYWLAPERWVSPILPDNFQGDFEMFFLSGIMMVAYATLIIMWNADVMVWLVSLFGRAFSRWLPAVKTAVAYPLASKTKTGLTLAMFALIMFSLVTMGTISANFVGIFTTEEAVGGWDIAVQTSPTNPIDNMREAVGDQADLSAVSAIGRVQSVTFTNTQVRREDMSDVDRKQTVVNGVDAEFAENTEMPMRNLAVGYETSEEVWQALATNPDLAVIDYFSAGPGGFGTDPNMFFLQVPDLASGVMEPVQVEVSDAASGSTRTVTVIGVIEGSVSTAFGLYTSQETLAAVFGTPDLETLFVKLTPEASENTDEIAMSIEQALFDRGVQVEATQSQLEELARTSTSFLQLIQGFMGLGLLVGIAALGVISFRAVVERRQQIGMLRAIGFKRNMVAAAFLIESMVIATLGVLTGVVLALILSWSLMTSEAFTEGAGEIERFIIPWGEVSFFVALSLIAAALLTVIPARNASSVPIAEALRYE
jgi:putative ABC transport system permease protein